MLLRVTLMNSTRSGTGVPALSRRNAFDFVTTRRGVLVSAAMYQPAHRRFEVRDPGASLADICRAVPATLVTIGPDGLRASILPMLFEPGDGGNGTLLGHLARGNPHWRDMGDGTGALAIFA